MIPVNAFSILRMVRNILIRKLWFFLLLMLTIGPAGAGGSRNPSCERILKRNSDRLQKLSARMQLSADEDCHSLLPLCVYAFADTSIETLRALTALQSELSGWVDMGQPCSGNACLLLAESYFLQRDYENVRKCLRLLAMHGPDSVQREAAELLRLRSAVAERQWDEAASLLEKRSFVKPEISPLTGNALTFALLEADVRLASDAGIAEKLQCLDELERIASLTDVQMQRLHFVRGQLLARAGRMREAMRSYSTVLESAPKGPLYAYAYVFRDACRDQLESYMQDSLDAEAERLENMRPFEPTMVESRHDSIFIYALYPYYFQDMASRYFLDESDTAEAAYDTDDSWYDDSDTTGISPEMLSAVFENWDSVSIHIPKADFSHLVDTIFLPLVDSGYRMPPFTAVTSEFGWRRYRYHYGVDTKNQTGDTIRCLFDGYVRIAKRSRTYGNLVVVRHLNGLETFYAHCSRLLVAQNNEVKAGDAIALVGSTGRSTGPHLHFETRYKGVPFNPRHMIDFDSNCLRSDTLKITRETFNYLKPYNGSKPASTSGAVFYKVRPGDTLSQIARKNRTTVAAIKRLNGLRSDFIRDGQRLRVR